MNWGARFVTRAHRKTRSIELMVRCNWLNAKELIRYHSLIQFWKVLKWKIPVSMYREYETDEDWHVTIPEPRLQMSRNCYLWRIGTQWNCLPTLLKETTMISNFKKLLKTWIMDQRLKTPDTDPDAPPGPDPDPVPVPTTTPGPDPDTNPVSTLQTITLPTPPPPCHSTNTSRTAPLN